MGATSASEVMKLLSSRYRHPDALALAELAKLRNMPRLSENPKDICYFASRIISVTMKTKTLIVQYYVYNAEVVRTVVEKLPSVLRYRYYDFAARTTRGHTRFGEAVEIYRALCCSLWKLRTCRDYIIGRPAGVNRQDKTSKLSTPRTQSRMRIKSLHVRCARERHGAVHCDKIIAASGEGSAHVYIGRVQLYRVERALDRLKPKR